MIRRILTRLLRSIFSLFYVKKLQVLVEHVKVTSGAGPVKQTKIYRYVSLFGPAKLVDAFFNELKAEINQNNGQRERLLQHTQLSVPPGKRKVIISLGVERDQPVVTVESEAPRVCLYSAFMVILCRFRDRSVITWDLNK